MINKKVPICPTQSVVGKSWILDFVIKLCLNKIGTKLVKKSAQEMQDEIFREMTTEQKLSMAFNFFRLAKKLNPSHFYAKKRRRKITAESHRHS